MFDYKFVCFLKKLLKTLFYVCILLFVDASKYHKIIQMFEALPASSEIWGLNMMVLGKEQNVDLVTSFRRQCKVKFLEP